MSKTKSQLFITAAVLSVIGISFGKANSAIAPTEKMILFNGENLEGWKPVLKKETKPDEIWNAENGFLKCSGKIYGYIRTKEKYNNYRLHTEWRWKEEGNSGIFLHLFGEDNIWPSCLECQLKSGEAGAILGMQDVTFKKPKELDTDYLKPKHGSSEKKVGRWNHADIYCYRDSAEIYINGILQNKAEKLNVNKGYIGLQSEGGKIEFRNVFLMPFNGKQENLNKGGKAPDLTLLDQDSEEVKLSDFKGQKVLLYFYPKAETPGCTRQACTIRDSSKALEVNNIKAIGISPDEPKKLSSFDENHSLGFTLLSDPAHEAADMYGVWTTISRGKRTRKRIIRSMFLIDEEGKILESFYGIKPGETVSKALSAIK